MFLTLDNAKGLSANGAVKQWSLTGLDGNRIALKMFEMLTN